MADVYANAYSVERGRCFRFIHLDTARGQPIPCPGEVVARGRWRDGGGKLQVVEACAAHAGQLLGGGASVFSSRRAPR